MPGFADEILSEVGERTVTLTEAQLKQQLDDAAAKEGEGATDKGSGEGTTATEAGTNAEGAEVKVGEAETKDGGKKDGEVAVNTAKKDEAAPPKVVVVDEAKGDDAAFDDEKLLKILQAKYPEIKSLDDLKPRAQEPTAEEKEQAQKELLTNAIQHGLKTKSFTTEDLEQYNLAKNTDPRELALEAFALIMRKNSDTELSDADIEERFSTYYGETLDEGHWMKALKEGEMKDLANNYLNGRFKAITNITNEYSETVRVEQLAHSYKSEVEATLAGLPKEFSFKVKGKEYNFEPSAETVNAIKEQFLSAAQLETFGNKVPDKALLQASIETAIKARDLNRIIESVSNSHAALILSEKMAGRKGILPARDVESNQHETQAADRGHAAGIIESMGV